MKPLQISLGNDRINVHIPAVGTSSAYTVAVPLSLDGLRMIYDLLKKRSAVTDALAKTHSIGSGFSPTQEQVEAWVRKMPKVSTLAPELQELADKIELDL